MDPVTHAALGALTGELTLGRQLGKRALAWGAFFGVLPDIDAILSLVVDTAHGLGFHRGFFHSVFFIALAAGGLAKPLSKRWHGWVEPLRVGVFIALAMGSHLLIDLFSVYGVQPFEPFSSARVSFDNLYIIDPVFTLPLIIAVLIVALAGLRKPAGTKAKPARKTAKKAAKKKAAKKAPKPPVFAGPPSRAPWWCLGVSFLYVGLSFWAKHAAAEGFGQDLAKRGVKWTRRMEAPTAMNLFLWRGLVERDGEIWLGYRSIFDHGDQPVSWTIFPKGEAAAEPYAGEREVKTVEWFSRGWWIARPAAGGVWMADLRFDERRDWDRRGVVLRPVFAWTFNATATGNRLRQLDGSHFEASDTLRRMGRRIAGDRAAWEGGPRLVGSFLALQEYLNVEEGK